MRLFYLFERYRHWPERLLQLRALSLSERPQRSFSYWLLGLLLIAQLLGQLLTTLRRPSDDPQEVLNGSEVVEAPEGAPRCNICCSEQEKMPCGLVFFEVCALRSMSRPPSVGISSAGIASPVGAFSYSMATRFRRGARSRRPAPFVVQPALPRSCCRCCTTSPDAEKSRRPRKDRSRRPRQVLDDTRVCCQAFERLIDPFVSGVAWRRLAHQKRASWMCVCDVCFHLWVSQCTPAS